MRIPGGDAVHRAYVVHGEVDQLVVEVENRSAVPFALALAVRPSNPLGPATVGAVELAGTDLAGRRRRRGASCPSRPPGPRPGSGADGDVVDLVVGGHAPVGLRARALPRRCGQRGGHLPAAPHGRAPRGPAAATARLAGPRLRVHASAARGGIADLPSAERVAKGWEAQVRRGTRVVVPAEALAATVEANRSFLLVAHAGDHLAGTSGPGRGWWPRCGRSTSGASTTRSPRCWPPPHDEPASGAVLVALAEHWRLTHDRDLVDQLSAALAAGVSRPGACRSPSRRRPVDRWRVPGLESAAELLAATGQESGGRDGPARRPRRWPRASATSSRRPVPIGWTSPRQVAAQASRDVEAGDAVASTGWRGCCRSPAPAGRGRSWCATTRWRVTATIWPRAPRS